MDSREDELFTAYVVERTMSNADGTKLVTCDVYSEPSPSDVHGNCTHRLLTAFTGKTFVEARQQAWAFVKTRNVLRKSG